MAKPKYWLMKTEPDAYSIQDLSKEKDQTACWDGVRNYQARNFMRDEMKIGDRVLIYHSNAKPPGVAGTAVITRESYPDHTAWDKNEKYYDPKSDEENPRWFMVDIKLEQIFENEINAALVQVKNDYAGMKFKQGLKQSTSRCLFNQK